MPPSEWDPRWVTAFKDALWALGILMGGLWVLVRYGLSRDHTTHLGLSASHRAMSPRGPEILTQQITFRLENRGKAKLSARPKPSQLSEPAFMDHKDRMVHACGLQVRRLPADLAAGLYDWYSLTSETGIDELDLMAQFESARDGVVDFHREPGEVVELTAIAALPEGDYLARVHFIGLARMDFCAHTFWLRAGPIERAAPKDPDCPSFACAETLAKEPC